MTITVHPDATVGPALWHPPTTCKWCRQPLIRMWTNRRYDIHMTPAGETRCTPAARGVQPGRPGHCVFGYYADERLMGPAVYDKRGNFKGGAFDPLTLKGHDGTCNCNVSLAHLPVVDPAERRPLGFEVPWHCGQPMMMRHYAPTLAAQMGHPGGWHCRAGGTELVPVRKGSHDVTIVPRGCQMVLPAAVAG